MARDGGCKVEEQSERGTESRGGSTTQGPRQRHAIGRGGRESPGCQGSHPTRRPRQGGGSARPPPPPRPPWSPARGRADVSAADSQAGGRRPSRRRGPPPRAPPRAPPAGARPGRVLRVTGSAR
ncbi:putative uncharacterized protein encoded by MAPKAPK5-AS1 [Odocoileus virginianus]|uniref:Uncharacterized protein n=1 Tax=Odocoileus virginianus TaxID=9874 RepID=A0ABM4IPV3_ODOVR